jgi:hypothetical protein
MALQDYLISGSYTTIDDIFFSKEKKNVSFACQVWKNSTKSVLIATNRKILDMSNTCLEVDRAIEKTDSVDWPLNRAYKVGETADENLKSNTYMYRGELGFSEIDPAQTLCDYEDGHYYKLVNGVFTKQDYAVDSRTFDSLFLIDHQDQLNVNIMKICYDYVKSLPDFDGASDV